MGMFTEKDGDFEYPDGHKFGGAAPRLKDSSAAARAYASGGVVAGFRNEILDDIHYKAVIPSHWYLEGYHKASGEWVKLAKFATEEAADAAIMACHSKTQPDRKKVSIVWEDFSAFKSEGYFTISYRI
ncbi:hypothetical protein DSS3P8_154 [Roseobacter phage DSS3P8]|nr:hypothetical protein DSS3P8_154 [Roseobacter phage DSS3P8]